MEQVLDSELGRLNDPQREAVTATPGPMLVIAGAGSGKTRVLTMRIAYLMANGVKPYNILALTFTNKAAREMKERIANIVGPKAKELWMGTFHSVFSRILRAEAATLGISPDFTIYDAEDSQKLIKNIVKEMELSDNYKQRDLASIISKAKNDLVLPAAYAQDKDRMLGDTLAHRPKTVQVYQQYVEECKKANVLDFDDLLLYTEQLFANHQDILEKYQQRFMHILVDEYQDTNHVQYAIINRLAKAHKNICVVGDDAQSIYSFRGARIENILNFQKDYPETRVFKLEQNYRSTQNIVNVANKLIALNKRQLHKDVFSKGNVGEFVHVWESSDDRSEARRVVGDIHNRTTLKGYSFNDCAILYRNNFLSRSMEEQLRNMGIPYRIYGGLAFYQRKEIKDVLAYLRLIVNHNDIEALRRIVNYPKRQIGDTTVAKVEATATELGSTPWDVMTISTQMVQTGLKEATLSKISRFTALIDTLTQQSEKMDAYQLTVEVLSQSGLLALLNAEKTTDEGKERYANVQELLNAIKEYVDENGSEDEPARVSDYLQQVSLITDMDQDDEGEKVTLMTIHASKGLEFGCVYIVGVEEEIFPGDRCGFDADSLEEERRLMYVALTRAKDVATVSYATTRYRFGKVSPCSRSRFISELNMEYCDGLRELSSLPSDDAFVEEGDILAASPWTMKRKQMFVPRTPRQTFTTIGNITPITPSTRYKKVEHRLTTEDLATETTTLTETPDGKFKLGSRVKHSRFGIGTVKEIIGGNSDDMKLRIAFEHEGEKTLLLKFARLEAL